MVLSAINHDNTSKANNPPGVADSRHIPNNKPFEFKTWAQTVKNQKRIFLQAIDKHSIVIAASEFEGLNFKDKSLNLVLRDQFPKGIGLRERKIGRTHQYIELNFDNEEDKMDALKKEFLILDRKIKVQTTMDKNSEVIRIGITNIPYEKDDKLKPLMIQLFEKYGSNLKIGLHHTVDGGWFNGRGYVTLVKDKTKNYEPLTPQIPSWEQDHNLHIVWTQCPDAPWNRKSKQVAIHRSRVMNANIEQVNAEKDTAILSNLQEMDTEMSEEDNSKPDSTSVAEDKDDFQEAISTLDSVDEENIVDSNLPIQIDEDSGQKKTGRKEATKRLLYPLVIFNSLYEYTETLEVEENAAFEDEYDENNSVPGGSSQPSTKLNL
ncbi:hypothetical protein G6F62_005301 [Rhizopus arrhizus]|nr:hypothetical protein G6F62_005301 [Rhizopus arrhizus]